MDSLARARLELIGLSYANAPRHAVSTTSAPAGGSPSRPTRRFTSPQVKPLSLPIGPQSTRRFATPRANPPSSHHSPRPQVIDESLELALARHDSPCYFPPPSSTVQASPLPHRETATPRRAPMRLPSWRSCPSPPARTSVPPRLQDQHDTPDHTIHNSTWEIWSPMRASQNTSDESVGRTLSPAQEHNDQRLTRASPPRPQALLLMDEAALEAHEVKRTGLCVICQDEEAIMAAVDCG
ncbi:hypothetical protein DFH08DRAFT_1083292 [Mycena albidolilacea]|uniref:Uncharacterized protein n=1 Tax=Mycena albidolilacea TaxID=1033008 RepID=A0AAD6ZQY7_9AGAR|nr:hypothetical protein DFH08DRAFT_1083292 [Mycena albidolilacea]